MGAEIEPGMWVERCDHLGLDPFGTLRCVVEVAEPGPCRCGHYGPGLILQGVCYRGEAYPGSCEAHWRPVYRPKADFIESLKAPPIQAPPVRISEDA